MILVHGIPVYWGVETEAVDKSFLTRATLAEVLPPFRQSIRAFRIRVSPWHWLHIGICRYEQETRRWDLGVEPDEIGAWGVREEVEDEVEYWDDDEPVRQVQQVGSDRPAGSDDDEEWGNAPWPESFRTGSGVGSVSARDGD